MSSVLSVLIGASVVAATAGPPTGPLQRHDPRVYDLAIDVTITTRSQPDARLYKPFHLKDAPIVMPVIVEGPYSVVDRESLAARLWLGGREDTALAGRRRLDRGFPYETEQAVLTIREFRGMSLRWQLGYRVQVWSSLLPDEAAAAAIPWPANWPKEAREALRPQMYVESEDPIFLQAVEHASGGGVREVPPYLAAKDLIRYSIQRIRPQGGGNNHGRSGALQGLRMIGARQAAARGLGGPHDLVCVCVAVLRAAGIPARPVIGVEKKPRGTGRASEFVSWAEFYLPEAGWVPFDPVEMRGKGIRHLDVRRPWPELGTLERLNRRIPLAYHFMPPAAVESPQNPSIWGWDPRPGGDPGSEQQIHFQITSRGRGVDDVR